MARSRLTAALGVAAALVLALPGFAAAAEGEKKNIFEPAFDLGLWTIIVFVVLFWVLRRYAWGPMLQGLRTREESIRAAIEEARLAREDTARARAEFDRKLAEAHAGIPKLMEEARRNSERLAEEMRAKAAQDIQADRQRLRREIETARDQALKDITDHTAQLATLISAKAIRRALTPEDHRRLVDEALAELKDEARKAQ
jgi:F-type H+-transporting ATPase subunit b